MSATLTGLFNHGGDTLYHSMMRSSLFMSTYLASIVAIAVSYRLSPIHPLAAFPGPIINRVTALKLAHIVYSGKRYLVIKDMHQKYGKFVRTGALPLAVSPFHLLTAFAQAQVLFRSTRMKLLCRSTPLRSLWTRATLTGPAVPLTVVYSSFARGRNTTPAVVSGLLRFRTYRTSIHCILYLDSGL
jgi:hypothetical protein